MADTDRIKFAEAVTVLRVAVDQMEVRAEDDAEAADEDVEAGTPG